MRKKSTLDLWDFILSKECSTFDRFTHKNLFEQKIEPKQTTINNILSYASSIKGVKMNSGENILISLN